jgi:hypothetical protein
MKQLGIILAITFFAALPFTAAEPAATPQDQQIITLVKALQAQNLAMAQNQSAIEAKIAAVGETVRQARVFTTGRGRK